jgi:N-acyl-D-aspartate/D-glutamate deacylase
VPRLGKNSVQADFDGTPMVTDTMPEEDLLDYASVIRERGGGGIIQVTMASGEGGLTVSNSDTRLEEQLAEASGAIILHNVVNVVRSNPEYHRAVLQWLDGCNRKGMRLFGQCVSARPDFVFSLDQWNLYDSSPAWNKVSTGTFEEKRAKFADPAIRRAMIDEYSGGRGPGDKVQRTQGLGGPIVDLLIVGPGTNPALEKFVGLTVGELATKLDKHPIDAMLDLSLEGGLKVEFATPHGGVMEVDPDLTSELFRSPYTLPGLSDGGAHTKFFVGGSFTTDLLCWLVRDTGRLSLEEAHFRLSMLPAFAAGFRDRGYLREGLPADIVVYDLAALKRVPADVGEIVYDLPGGDWRRVQRAEGYRWTLVNGAITFEDGRPTGALPGTLLRHGRAR